MHLSLMSTNMGPDSQSMYYVMYYITVNQIRMIDWLTDWLTDWF